MNDEQIANALKKIFEVEREHLFGSKTGADSARRTAVQRVVDKIILEAEEARAAAENERT
jgi:hypothetical protein